MGGFMGDCINMGKDCSDDIKIRGVNLNFSFYAREGHLVVSGNHKFVEVDILNELSNQGVDINPDNWEVSERCPGEKIVFRQKNTPSK